MAEVAELATAIAKALTEMRERLDFIEQHVKVDVRKRLDRDESRLDAIAAQLGQVEGALADEQAAKRRLAKAVDNLCTRLDEAEDKLGETGERMDDLARSANGASPDSEVSTALKIIADFNRSKPDGLKGSGGPQELAVGPGGNQSERDYPYWNMNA